MTTIINTPPTGESADSGAGLVLGILLALILVILFFVYALPALRDNTPPKADNIDINVQVPADETAPIPEVTP
ncbi:MAG: hypothetical protein A2571_03595 [Candidatus Vogelbacteria bacterium RIFOXYD1_FULL_44_32]|uniref:Uncharacterized protein n=1 Tax=Candidatus Vogelbacteria bacterium RIFOXYD1_FULL_44_32 TaxID=1802438 RepID=A0A1G2QC82_9BACT|nr:MAG: hypothetical protein A2571_03595 [Candidatus Vogelbacteria bacterium RIFOXYD1_FULL_44_32]